MTIIPSEGFVITEESNIQGKNVPFVANPKEARRSEVVIEIKIKSGGIYHDNKKVGKIGLSELDTPNPQFIDYIEVFPQYRGRGFARATIELLKSQYSEIIIGNPHENNPEVERIREFWRKMEFNTIGNFISWEKRGEGG